MSRTYVQNLLHVVFSTKERRKLIPLDYRAKLWAYNGRRFAAKKRSCRTKSAGWMTILIC